MMPDGVMSGSTCLLIPYSIRALTGTLPPPAVHYCIGENGRVGFE